MKHPKRFTDAVTKLYNAFHKGELEANDCSDCAVGNICDNSMYWDDLGVFYSNYGIPKNKAIALRTIEKTGYSVNELIKVEKLFMYEALLVQETKETQFKGLCAVIKYLCELDNIPNIMDYTSLFETESNKSIRQLSEVFA